MSVFLSNIIQNFSILYTLLNLLPGLSGVGGCNALGPGELCFCGRS